MYNINISGESFFNSLEETKLAADKCLVNAGYKLLS